MYKGNKICVIKIMMIQYISLDARELHSSFIKFSPVYQNRILLMIIIIVEIM